MQIPSYHQLGIFSYSSYTKQKATTEENLSLNVKQPKRFSLPVNDYSDEDIENLSDRAATKDTDSETKDHREDSDTISPATIRGSGLFSSRMNSMQAVPKPILKTPKYGMLARKAASIPTIQSFVDGGFTDDESDTIYPTNTVRVSTAGRLESGRPHKFTVSTTSKTSIMSGQGLLKKAKTVTFADKIAESEPSLIRANSVQESKRPVVVSLKKAAPIKLTNNFICSPSPRSGEKTPAKLFTFSSDELVKIRNLTKEKNSLREEAITVPKTKIVDTAKKLEAPRIDMKSCSSIDSYGLKPHPPTVTNQTTFRLRIPATLTPTNALKSCERFSSSEKSIATPRIIVRQGPLSSRRESSSAAFVRREFNKNIVNMSGSLMKQNLISSK